MAQTTKQETKSEAIRQYLRSARSSKARLPQAVTAALAEQGVSVTTGLVSQVKLSMKKKDGQPKRSYRRKTQYEYEITVDHLVAAKSFLAEMGGDPDAAKAALDALSKLQ
jgi:hypothetical protein